MDREERAGRIITYTFSAVLAAALALLVVLKTGIVFETNDDATLRNIASGAFTGNPDAHLIYIMYPLGLILKGLYTIAGNVNWYDYVMSGLHFVCLFLILSRLGNIVKNNINRIVTVFGAFLFLVAIELKFLAIHQYTELAGILAATALLFIGTYNYKKKSKSDIVLVIVLLLISLWLRKQVFFLCAPFAVLLIVLSIFETNDTMDDRFERFKRLLVPVGVTVILTASSFIAETIAYSSPEWKAFKKYNEARTTVYDYNMLADYDPNQSFYEGIGISREEYTVLREYGLILMDDCNADTLTLISKQAKENAREWAQYYSVPRKILNDTSEAFLSLTSYPVVLACLILFVALMIACFLFDNRLSALVVLASAVYTYVFVALFTYKERLPERVFHGFFLMEILFLTAVLTRMIVNRKTRHIPSAFWEIMFGICWVSVMGIMCLFAYRQTADRAEEKLVATERWIELNKFFKENQDNIYITNNSVFAAAGDVVFAEGTTDSFNVVTGNWTLGGPLFEERNSRLFNMSVHDALTENERVYYVQLAGKDTQWLESYFGSAEVAETVTVSDGTSYDIISLYLEK